MHHLRDEKTAFQLALTCNVCLQLSGHALKKKCHDNPNIRYMAKATRVEC